MSKLVARGAAFAFAVAAVAQPAAAQLGPDAAACRAGNRPAILVNVSGFKARSGNVRVNVYANADTFLDRGRYIRQINLPVSAAAMPVCVALPRPGRYAVAVRHDVSGNGNDWGDGGGFSRNPRLSLTNLRPSFETVAFNVGGGLQPTSVVLNYRFGLSIRPVS